MAKPYLPNLEPYIAAGIDLKTGLPKKALFGSKLCLKEDIKKALRIIDEQDACGRYKWTGLEKLNLTSQELERMIYYKGQLCLFYIKEIDQYCVLPYALSGTIDLYGRFNEIRPIPFSNGTTENNDTPLSKFLSKMSLKCIYGTETKIDDPSECCVLLHDYTKQLSQTIIPRVTINEPILDVMSDCIPFMRTRLELSTGIKGIRVNDADQADAVRVASDRMEDAALKGKAYIPIVGSIDFQDLATDRAGDSSEYMLAMQSLDNFRLSTYGISNGGLFEKKAHELNAENEMSNNINSLVLQDGLDIRKHFCEVANKVYNLNIQVESCEDMNQQMVADTDTETIIEGEDNGNEDTTI